MGGNWVPSRTYCKKLRENINLLTILISHLLADDCRENNHWNQKYYLGKGFTISCSMGGNWVPSRTFSKKVGENKNVLTILPSYPIAEDCRENKHGSQK